MNTAELIDAALAVARTGDTDATIAAIKPALEHAADQKQRRRMEAATAMARAGRMPLAIHFLEFAKTEMKQP